MFFFPRVFGGGGGGGGSLYLHRKTFIFVIFSSETRFLKPCKLASKRVSGFESYHASILFANARGASPPTSALLNRASLLQHRLIETHDASIAFLVASESCP